MNDEQNAVTFFYRPVKLSIEDMYVIQESLLGTITDLTSETTIRYISNTERNA